MRVWVVSLLTLPVVAALVGSSWVVDWSESSWRWRSILWIVLGAGVPLVAALAHTRRFGVVFVTLVAGATTYPAIRNLVRGEVVHDTHLRAEVCAVHERHGMRCIEHRVSLDDGADVYAEHALVAPLGELRGGESVRVVTIADVAVRLERRR